MVLADEVGRWLRSATNARAVTGATMLPGSTTATVLEFRVTNRSGRSFDVVAKVYDRPTSGDDAKQAVVAEARGLDLAKAAAISAPLLVAVDGTNGGVGVPVIAMTRLPGRPIVRPRPSHPGPSLQTWVEGLAAALRSIAAADVNLDALSSATSWSDPSLARPEWFADDDLWTDAVARLASGFPLMPDGFLHRDFHTLNVLWSADRVSGIVDWVHACRGPIAFDLSRCRMNIALTMGLEAADEFLRACGDIGDGYDHAWDLEFIVGIAEHSAVLLTGNGLGAELTLDSIHSLLVEASAQALRTHR